MKNSTRREFKRVKRAFAALSLAICLFAVTFLSGCAEKIDFSRGEYVDGHMVNGDYGIKLDVPAGWDVADQELINMVGEIIRKLNEDVLSKKFGKRALTEEIVFIPVIDFMIMDNYSNSAIVVEYSDLSYFHHAVTPEKFLMREKKLAKEHAETLGDYNFSEIEKVKLGEHEFHKVEKWDSSGETTHIFLRKEGRIMVVVEILADGYDIDELIDMFV